jgi:multiple RNA-binding domain-containing protein 1
MEALVSSGLVEGDGKRSSTAILVKNLPFDTKEDDLMKLFTGVGDGPRRILLPPSRTIAMVEYSHSTDAKRAFKKLAYKRFKHVPLYLEWAPLAAQLESNVVIATTGKTSTPIVNEVDAEGQAVTGDNDGDTPTVSYSIYVKNLNFATTEDQLQQLFAKHVPVRAVRIPSKVAAMKKIRTNAEESDVLLSMGYGFVECDSEESVRKAVSTLQGYMLDGHALELKKSSKAVGASPRVPAKSKGKNPTKLMVRNVPFQASRTEILKLFGSFGQLKKVRLPKKFDGGHRGFAFIEFLTSQEAQTAMVTLSRTHLYGRHLVLEWADDKDDMDTLREKAKRDIDEKPVQRVNKKIRFK